MIVTMVIPMGSYANEVESLVFKDQTLKYANDRILVQYAEGTTELQKTFIRSDIEAVKTHGFVNKNMELLKLKNKNVQEILKKIKLKKQVVFAEPDYLLTIDSVPNDPKFTSLWGLNNAQNIDMDAPEAWNIQTGSKDVLVAIIDEGVDIGHEDLSANIWVNPGEIAGDGIDNDGNGYIDDIHGWDFFNKDNSVYDGIADDHGTHVAGTIAAVGNNGIGVIGVAPNVTLMPLKFIGPTGGYSSDAIKAIEYATAKGAKVINASWGGGSYSALMLQAISSFPGVFVASAGNNSLNLDVTPYYPACYDSANIITVAAIESTGGVANYSNYGARQVEIGAPGTNVLSTMPGNAYGSKSGTSMAAPHVSGVVALLFSHDAAATSSTVIQTIVNSAKDHVPLQGKTIYGSLINANRALTGQFGHAPWVKSSVPIKSAIQQPVGQPITVVFSEPVQIDMSKIILADGTVPVERTTTYADQTLTVMPHSYNTDTQYTLMVPASAVVDVEGLPMLADFVLSFKTVDTIAPRLLSTYPTQGTTNVAPENLSITMTFSENLVKGATFSNIHIADASGATIPYLATISSSKLTIKPSVKLQGQVAVTIPVNALADASGLSNTEPLVLEFTISSFDGQVLPFAFTNALMDPNRPVIYLFNQYEKDLHIYNYETQSDQTLTMNTPIVAMTFKNSMSSDKLYLALSEFRPNSNDTTKLQSGFVSVINLTTMAEEIFFPLRINPYDIAVDRSGAIIVSSANNQLTTIEAYSSAGIYSHSKQIRQQSLIEMHPNLDRLYTITTDLSPRDYIVYPVQNGVFSEYDDSIYHGDHTLNKPFDIDSSGQYLFNGSGVIYTASEDINKDMRYVTQLDASFVDVAFNASGSMAYTLPTAREVAVYETQYFKRVHAIPLFAPGKAIFEKNGEVAVLMSLTSTVNQAATGLAFYPVSNVVPPQVLISNPVYGEINVPVEPQIVLDLSNDVVEGPEFSKIALYENDVLVPSTVSILGHQIIITAQQPLAFNARCSVVVPKGAVQDHNGLPFMADYTLHFTTKWSDDNTAPSVTSSLPENGSISAERTPEIRISFDEALLPGKELNNIILLRDGQSKMTTTAQVIGNELVIKQSVPFTYSTFYTLSIPALAITDLSGNPMVASYNMQFTTKPAPDTVAPYVSSSSPYNTTNAPLNTKVTAIFSEQVVPADGFSNIRLMKGSEVILADVVLSGNSLTITPTSPLQQGTQYTYTIPAGSVKDLAGNVMTSSRTSNFTTVSDTTAPTVIATSPGKDAALTSLIEVTFSENIQLASRLPIKIMVGKKSFTLTDSHVTVNGNKVIIDLGKLLAKTTYTVTIGAGTVKDLAGNLQTSAKTFSFTTVR
jgi:subtilisin family serine protease